MLDFIPVAPGERHPVVAAWDAIGADTIRVASAFATESGAQELRALIGGDFDAANKHWLIGIQEGITQPAALRYLQARASSDVRVPFGSAALASPTLRAPIFFHPKLYYLENSRSGATRLLSGSANLTYRGLHAGVEQFLTWGGTRRERPARRFSAWWTGLWRAADLATSSFIDRYESVRPILPTPARAIAGGPPDDVLQRATEFWIELTRRPEGGSFNQVELLFNGHFFFYPRRAPRPDRPQGLTFEDALGMVYDDPGRRIVFNGPPRRMRGNHMWRVYMPTAAMGFVGYQDGDAIVHFARTRQRDHYLIEVAPARSPQAFGWIRSAAGVAAAPGPPPRRMGWA